MSVSKVYPRVIKTFKHDSAGIYRIVQKNEVSFNIDHLEGHDSMNAERWLTVYNLNSIAKQTEHHESLPNEWLPKFILWTFAMELGLKFDESAEIAPS